MLADIISQLDTIISDYPNALKKATDLDNKIFNAANVISQQYAILVSLAARQVMGSTELTISKDVNGGWNISDVKVFMKDIGTSR